MRLSSTKYSLSSFTSLPLHRTTFFSKPPHLNSISPTTPPLWRASLSSKTTSSPSPPPTSPPSPLPQTPPLPTRGEKVLNQVIRAIGGVTPSQLQKLHSLSSHLLHRTKQVNLTAVRTHSAILEKHIAESLTLIPLIESHPEILCDTSINKIKILDVGSGGGFPGLPIGIVRPEWEVVLLESKNKKVQFHLDMIRELSLDNMSSICVRAENLGKDNRHREKYEFVIARAVADTRRLLEMTIPFVKIGGYFLAMKTVDFEGKELDVVKKGLRLLGGKIAGVFPAWGGVNPFREVAGVQMDGHFKAVVKFEKAHETPRKYPRDSKNIKKRPLGIHK